MLIYEASDSWTIHGYLDSKCWDGKTGLDRLSENGIEYKIGKNLNGVEIAKNGHYTSTKSKAILIAWEPPLVVPSIYDGGKGWMGKLYTSIQPDGLHITTPNPLQYDKLELQKKDKLVCMVISNKKKEGYNSIYDLRQEIVSIGEKNKNFDLYGMGWPNSPVYRGQIPWDRSVQSELWRPKVQKMSEYKFAFVTENSRINGYVTEKIINALVARCIPIYLGAPDIVKYVPKNCFIDLSKLSVADAFKYIQDISDDEYAEFLFNIESFITSESAYFLSSYYLADRILEAVRKK